MKINPYRSTAKYVAVSGIMLGIAAALTAIESMLSVFMPAGVRIGLANIVVLTAAACINLPTAFIIALLKSVFVFLTRGITAGAMSFGGGMLAFAVTAVMLSMTRASYVMISVSGAIAHIIGQLIVAALLTQSKYTFYYAPLLIATGTASGFVTGAAANAVIPHFSNIKK